MPDLSARRIFVLLKDVFKHHRKITSVQKILIFTIVLVIFTALFRNFYLLLISFTYFMSIYGSVIACRRVLERRHALPSDFILIFLEKVDDILSTLRELIHDLFYPNENECSETKETNSDSSSSKAGEKSQKGKNKQENDITQENGSSDNTDGEEFYDATDDQPSRSLFYIVHDGDEENLELPHGNTDSQEHTSEILQGIKSKQEFMKFQTLVGDCVKTSSTRDPHLTFQQRISQEIDLLISLVLRDFVRVWFTTLSDNIDIFEEGDDVFHQIANNIRERIIRSNKLTIAKELIIMFRQHVNTVKSARTMFKIQPRRRKSHTKASSNTDPPSPSKFKFPYFTSVVDCFANKTHLHPAVQSQEAELRYLHGIVDVLIKYALPKNVNTSRCAQCLLNEVLTCNVFLSIMNRISDSTFVHERVIKITSDEEIDSADLNISQTNLISAEGEPVKSILKHNTQSRRGTSSDDKTKLESETAGDFICSAEKSTKAAGSATELCSKKSLGSGEVPQFKELPMTLLKAATVLQADAAENDKTERLGGALSETEANKVKNTQENVNEVVMRQKKGSSFSGGVSQSQKSVGKRTSDLRNSRSGRDLAKIDESSEVFEHDLFDDEQVPFKLQPPEENDGFEVFVEETPLTFPDICIPSTETAKESGLSNFYTLYIVQYEALYPSQSNRDSLVIRTGTVRRRFREFVNLQARLEDKPEYRKCLKDVKGPRKWLSLPFGNMDKENIESRRKILETYLKALIQKEEICNGPELKEFLGYDGHGHIAFVRKPPDSAPRLDKVIVRKMSGVFDKLVEALPSLPSDLPSLTMKKETPKEEEVTAKEDLDQIILSCVLLEDKSENQLPYQQMMQTFVSSKSEEFLQTDSDGADEEDQTILGMSSSEWQSEHLSNLPRTEGDGADKPDPVGAKEAAVPDQETYPLSSAVIDILVEGLQGRDSWLCRDQVMTAGRVLLCRALDRYLGGKIDFLMSAEMTVFYLQTLRETFWPDGVWSNDPTPSYTEHQKDKIKQQATRCLKEFLPGVLPVLLGEEDFDFSIEEIVETLSYPQLNRHSWYSFLDVLLEKLFPEVSTVDIQQSVPESPMTS